MISKEDKKYIKKEQEAKEVAEYVNKLNESEKEEQESNIQEISYTRATFWKRCSIILFDLICCFLLSMGCFIGLQKIVDSTPKMKQTQQFLGEKQYNSQIFIYSSEKNKYFTCVEYYELSPDMRPEQKKYFYEERIDYFFNFLDEEIGTEEAKIVYDDYNAKKLNENMVKDGLPLFIKLENGEIVENDSPLVTYDDMNKIFYEPYIEEILVGVFFAKVPHVYDAQKYISNMFFYLEIPLALFIGFTIIYYIIPLCFYRGKQTLGRLVFKTGLVDKDVLCVKFWRFTLRYLILFFVEVILSIFTLGIPIFVSFSLMAFSKKKQNFHDYMLGIEEVDLSSDKIYKNMDELIAKPLDYDLENFTPIRK